MAIIDIIKNRYSVRDYKHSPVEEEKLRQVLEAARWAPSACNNQPCRCIVIRENARKQLLRPAYNREWFISAPGIIAVCVDVSSAWRRSDGIGYGFVDAAIVMDHLILAATELGLGTCWIGAFKTAEAKKALALPDHIEPVVFTPLGYPKQPPAVKSRKPLEEIVCWELFEEKK